MIQGYFVLNDTWLNLSKAPLRIDISSDLLNSLKGHAIRSGLTLQDLVQKILLNGLFELQAGNISSASLVNEQQSLQIPLVDPVSFGMSQTNQGLSGKRFTDAGAKAYAQAARTEFQKHSAIKGLELDLALKQLPDIVAKYQGDLDLITQILIGRHELTGDEMVQAIHGTGNCPMMKALQEWTGEPLAALSKVFVDAIEI